MEKETALVEAILFLESEPLSEEAISIIGQLSKDVVDIALENLKERYSSSPFSIFAFEKSILSR